MEVKKLEYYLGLVYDIIIRTYKEDGDIIYKAFTNELNQNEFYGVGDSTDEAIDSFHAIKKEWFEYYIENSLPITEPEKRDEDLPSGKFVVRINPSTHHKLARMAKKNSLSLNYFINNIIEQYCTFGSFLPMVQDQLKMAIGSIISRKEQPYEFRSIQSVGNDKPSIETARKQEYRRAG